MTAPKIPFPGADSQDSRPSVGARPEGLAVQEHLAALDAQTVLGQPLQGLGIDAVLKRPGCACPGPRRRRPAWRGTAAWMITGPESISSVTKCTVQPEILTPYLTRVALAVHARKTGQQRG